MMPLSDGAAALINTAICPPASHSNKWTMISSVGREERGDCT